MIAAHYAAFKDVVEARVQRNNLCKEAKLLSKIKSENTLIVDIQQIAGLRKNLLIEMSLISRYSEQHKREIEIVKLGWLPTGY